MNTQKNLPEEKPHPINVVATFLWIGFLLLAVLWPIINGIWNIDSTPTKPTCTPAYRPRTDIEREGDRIISIDKYQVFGCETPDGAFYENQDGAHYPPK